MDGNGDQVDDAELLLSMFGTFAEVHLRWTSMLSAFCTSFPSNCAKHVALCKVDSFYLFFSEENKNKEHKFMGTDFKHKHCSL